MSPRSNGWILKFYSESFLNHLLKNDASPYPQFLQENQTLDALVGEYEDLYWRIDNDYRYRTPYCLAERFKPKFEQARLLIENLFPFTTMKFPQSDDAKLQPTKAAVLRQLEDALRRLNSHVDETTQTMAFANEFLHEIYQKEIVMVHRFRFVRGSKLFYDLNSHIDIGYHICFPFNSAKPFNETEPCVSDLPPHFQKEHAKSQGERLN